MTDAPAQQPEGGILHFLRELPAWCVIGLYFTALLILWQVSHDDFIPRIIDALVGALLLSMQRAKAPNAPTDTLQTELIETESLTVAKEKK